jgi:protein-S-isoprenylcysteine O-methyltransferase Ste14
MPSFAATAAQRFRSLRRTKLYDLLAALPLIAWFAFCVWQMLPALVAQIALARLFIRTDPSTIPTAFVLSLAAKLLVLAFLALLGLLFAIRYVPHAGASGLYPRVTAIAGTFLGVSIVALPPQELSTALYVGALVLMIWGFAFALWGVFCLGRSISILPEARRLVTRGPYAFIRHPIYLGEMVATAGLALQFRAPWAELLLLLLFIFQFLRMQNEERLLLGVFPDYAAYMARTARLLPGVY